MSLPTNNECLCHFCIPLVFNKPTQKWYLKCNDSARRTNFTTHHTNHLPIQPEDLSQPIKQLSPQARGLIDDLNKQDVPPTKISNIVLQKHQVYVSVSAIILHCQNCFNQCQFAEYC